MSTVPQTPRTFTLLPLRVTRDATLSLAARGLYAYLATMDGATTMDQLYAASASTRAATDRAMGELAAAGLVDGFGQVID